VWLTWQEPLGDDVTAVRAMRSHDAGITWSDVRDVARTKGTSDHPLLLARDRNAFLSWFTAAEGYRLIPID
jgi:hypothetical protein